MVKILLLVLVCAGFVRSTPTQPKLHPSFQQRIRNGTSGNAPYMVSLRRKPYNRHTCGGAILNERWILTAAHCLLNARIIGQIEFLVAEPMPQDLVINTGSNELAAQNAYDVEKISIHENWNPFTLENDIALLKVSSPIKIDNDFTQSIPLGHEVVEAGKTAEICGWGGRDGCFRTAKKLQCLKQTTISNRRCKESYKILFNATKHGIYDSHICTSTPKLSASCYGDSGGPLVVDGKIVGLVSLGKPGCALGEDEVYTRVSSFISWINSTMSDH